MNTNDQKPGIRSILLLMALGFVFLIVFVLVYVFSGRILPLKPIATFHASRSIVRFGASSDGRWLMSFSGAYDSAECLASAKLPNANYTLWNIASGAKQLEFESENYSSLHAFHNDNSWVLQKEDTGDLIWFDLSGEEVQKTEFSQAQLAWLGIHLPVPAIQSNWSYEVSPQGDKLLVRSGSSHILFRDSRSSVQLEETKAVLTIPARFTPDGERVVGISEHPKPAILEWEVNTGKHVRTQPLPEVLPRTLDCFWEGEEWLRVDYSNKLDSQRSMFQRFVRRSTGEILSRYEWSLRERSANPTKSQAMRFNANDRNRATANAYDFELYAGRSRDGKANKLLTMLRSLPWLGQFVPVDQFYVTHVREFAVRDGNWHENSVHLLRGVDADLNLLVGIINPTGLTHLVAVDSRNDKTVSVYALPLTPAWWARASFASTITILFAVLGFGLSRACKIRPKLSAMEKSIVLLSLLLGFIVFLCSV